MAKKTQSERLADYRLKVDISRRWRSEKGYDALWKRMIDMYRGRQFDNLSEEDQIAVNIAKSTIDIIAPSVAINNPKMTVTSRSEEKADEAVVTEAVLDYWFEAPSYGFQPEIRLAVNDYLMIGHGWVKTTWSFKEKEQPLADEDMEAAFAEQANIMDQYAQVNPELAPELPTDDEIWAALDTTQLVVEEDRPVVERVSPFDIFVDPEGTSARNIGWICQKIVMPMDEAKANEAWDAQARKNLAGSVNFPSEWIDSKVNQKKDTRVQQVTIYEFYDIKKNTLAVFSEGGDRFLIPPQPIPYKTGQPFEMLRNFDIPDHFYPMGELEAIEPLQKELNKTRSELMKQRSQFTRKVLYREEAFAQDAVKALKSKEDEWVGVKPGQWMLTDVAVPAPTAPPAPELYNHSAEIMSNMDVVTATSEYDRGGAMSEIRRTATEAAMIQDRSNARSSNKLAQVERWLGGVAATVHCLAREFLTTDQVAHIVGKKGAIWVPYGPETFNFEADFRIVAGSTQPVNEIFKQQQISNMLQSLGPLIGQVIDPVAIARHALEAFGVKNPEKFLMMPPPVDAATQDPNQGPPGAPPPEGDPSQVPPEEAALLEEAALAEASGVPPELMGAFGGTPPPPLPPELQGVPPEILAQLIGQVGVGL